MYEAYMSGLWATVGSTLGKLSGADSIAGDSYGIWGCLLVAMVVVNTWGCRCYLRALDASTNSTAPTIISATSSYILSGIVGIFCFGEETSIMWWAGTNLIVLGLTLIGSPKYKRKQQ